MVPAGVPSEVSAALGQTLLHIIESAEIRRAFGDLGMTPTPLGAADFAQFIRSERTRWLPLIKSLAITAD
jgi:tripartite-type tricarboxylate transporter receptor subunit TctC